VRICNYAYRLREIVRRLETGQVDNTTLINNLQYAADVLENVYKVENMYVPFLAQLSAVYTFLFIASSNETSYIVQPHWQVIQPVSLGHSGLVHEKAHLDVPDIL